MYNLSLFFYCCCGGGFLLSPELLRWCGFGFPLGSVLGSEESRYTGEGSLDDRPVLERGLMKGEETRKQEENKIT